MPCKTCGKTGHNRTTCALVTLRESIMKKQLKVAPAPAEVKPTPTLAERVAAAKVKLAAPPAPKSIDLESVSSSEIKSVESFKASSNSDDYIRSRINKLDQQSLDFLMRKLKPYMGVSSEWSILHSKYIDNPERFVLDTSYGHFTPGDQQPHHTLHYNYFADKWLHYHLYYINTNQKPKYTHCTTLDAFKHPKTIAAWASFANVASNSRN